MQYKIEITEYLQRIIIVDANDEYEALDMVNSSYDNCDIILDDSDFILKEINVVE